MLIAIDGPDGSGKTELTSALTERFNHAGLSVGQFGGYYLPETYHHTLMELKRGMTGRGTPIPGETEQVLYSLEWLSKINGELPLLQEENDVVVCDRYVLSRFALAFLQLSSTSVDLLRTAISLGNIPKPTYNILLMAKPEVLSERISKRSKRLNIEREIKEQPEILNALCSEFIKSVQEIPWEVERVDASPERSSIHEHIWQKIVSGQLQLLSGFLNN